MIEALEALLSTLTTCLETTQGVYLDPRRPVRADGGVDLSVGLRGVNFKVAITPNITRETGEAAKATLAERAKQPGWFDKTKIDGSPERREWQNLTEIITLSGIPHTLSV